MRGAYNHGPTPFAHPRAGRNVRNVRVGASFGDAAKALGGPFVTALFNGHEISDEEIRKATEAANRAVAPLVDARAKMLLAWSPSLPLSREQMTTIMQNALIPARETEKDLTAMIDKVPAHWEATVRGEGGLPSLRQALGEAAGFEALIAANTKDGKPVVVPGFRAWIDHLLSRTEDGVTAIAYVSDVLPDWLRMRDILSALHRAAVGVINAVIAIGKAAANIVEDPGKYLLIGAGIIGGGLALALIAKAGK